MGGSGFAPLAPAGGAKSLPPSSSQPCTLRCFRGTELPSRERVGSERDSACAGALVAYAGVQPEQSARPSPVNASEHDPASRFERASCVACFHRATPAIDRWRVWNEKGSGRSCKPHRSLLTTDEHSTTTHPVHSILFRAATIAAALRPSARPTRPARSALAARRTACERAREPNAARPKSAPCRTAYR